MENIAERIDKIMTDVLFKDEEIVDGKPSEDAVLVEGIVRNFSFHHSRLESHREEIRKIIAQMPKPFFRDSGGGWSTLNLCMTESGDQWGEHRNVEALAVLAIGLKLGHFLMPRDMWKIFPGGMPYVMFENGDAAIKERK